MRHVIPTRLILLPLLAIAFTACAAGRLATTASHLPQGASEVRYCDLARHPDRYDGQLVLVSAIYDSNFEQAVLVDPGCRQALTWVEFDPRCEPTAALRRKLSRVGTSASELPRLTVLGRFDGRRGFGSHGLYNRLTVVSLYDVTGVARQVGR